MLALLAGLVLLAIPLLRDLHLESAMLAGILGCFWGGIRAAKSGKHQDILASLHILGYLYIAAIPLFIYTLFSGCLTIDGVGFWLMIPIPSVFFGSAVGRLIRRFDVPIPKTITVAVLLFCAIGIWLIEFFTLPQVYFYNHVWGVWPGPIYDEAIQLTGSLFFFRWITFLWIVLFWLIPDWSKTLQTKLITGLALLSLMFSYLSLNEMGIISPRQSIQQQLGGHHTSGHFEIYYDKEHYDEQEIRYWAARHEFHLEEIEQALNVSHPSSRKIESYLYAHAWQKKKITGAKFTSYVPIWLQQDQLHIAKQQLDAVLKHELVHVVSKQFGNRLFNGSYSFGLIEGLAEAIAKDASGQSTLHQLVAAETPWPDARQMQHAMSIRGFYGSAGAISYTTTGSFTEFLLDNYPPEFLKEAYACGDIEEAYPQTTQQLVEGWHEVLEATPLDSTDRQLSEFIFARRSLFQKTCPHAVNPEWRLWDQYQKEVAEDDTSAIWKVLEDLYAMNSGNALVKEAWERAQLQQQKPEAVTNAITPNDSLLSLQAMHADALFLGKGYAAADSLLQIYTPKIRSSEARNLRYTLDLRADSLQWSYHLKRRYDNWLPDSATFEQLNHPNKMLSVDQALRRGENKSLTKYAAGLLKEEAHEDWFDIYERTIDRLVFLGHYDLAKKWIEKTENLDLRLRHQERLQQQKEWLKFMLQNSGNS
ncbi:hypothetical protein [Gracilimonas mengyeensis]|uniref:Uncharacterized protein n=1 Tax=Gracilimonas mengyeensis TaxID=1302730 RepID=A0A521CWM3_9BACT|nr:hypothetical protein [Gracilimonas mengyeensis]SMO63808.1 hypothetical protein SAMN06265219_106171 [Gracilimonas mengyeensis]